MNNQQPDADTLVIGAGSWGTALAILISGNGYPTLLWGNEPEQLKQLAEERQNRQYLPEGIIFPEQLQICTDLKSGLLQAKHILVVVPSHAFRIVLEQIQPLMAADACLCWATKGFEQQSHRLLHQVAGEVLGEDFPLSMVSGPTVAAEVAKGLPTAMTVAAKDNSQAEKIAKRLRNRTSRVYTHTDLVGVQVGGSAKNVIAIAAGIASVLP